MAISFSGMRKYLEQEMMCGSLKGRVRYFATRYRECFDHEGRMAILLDGKEVFWSSWFKWNEEYHNAHEEGCPDELSDDPAVLDYWDDVAHARGGMDQFCFYNAFHVFQNQSIEKSLEDQDSIVRLFAILDKRVGKRRLDSLKEKVADQPEWLQPFYRLRLEADQIVSS